MNRVALMVSGSLITGACATTQPYEAAGIDYRLPRTDASVTAALTLRSCAPPTVDANLAIAPEAGAQDGFYHLAGADLASARIKRDIKIDVSEEGVITGINSTNEDKTPEIIGNVLKVAGTVVAMGLGRPYINGHAPIPGPLVCRPDTANALARAQWLKGEISRLRERLVQVPAQPALVKSLNRSASELAKLQERELRVETKGSLRLDRPTGATETPVAVVDLDMTPFVKWFDEPTDQSQKEAHQAALANAFGLTWKAVKVADPSATPQPVLPAAKSLRSCGFAIAVPAVANVQVQVDKSGSALPADLRAKKALPAAQWSDPGKLCLDVGFGEQRSIDLTFNKFGQTTEFHWGSEATAATVSAAVAGYAPDVAGMVSTARGHALATKKAEIDEIETEQKLEELRRCKRMRDAGGDCTQGD